MTNQCENVWVRRESPVGSRRSKSRVATATRQEFTGRCQATGVEYRQGTAHSLTYLVTKGGCRRCELLQEVQKQVVPVRIVIQSQNPHLLQYQGKGKEK